MNVQIRSGRLQIERHGHVQVIDGRGASVRCLLGSLWLTQDGDPRDIVLTPGDSFTLDRDGMAIIFATAESTVALSAAH